MFQSYNQFIEYIIHNAKNKVAHYCGGMLIDIVHNVQGNAIIVVWSNYSTGVAENYTFLVIGSDEFSERVNNGEDFSQQASNLISNIYRSMVMIESKQTGRPPRI